MNRNLLLLLCLPLAIHGCGLDEASQSSAVTSTFEAESASWTFTAPGEIRSTPSPTHRYFWANGDLYRNHTFVAGSTTVTVRVRGELAGGVGPHIVVKVGNTQIGATTVNETTWTSKTFTFTATASTQVLRITYDNDAVVGGQDRNLMVDWVSVQSPDTCTGATYEAENMFHSTGGATVPAGGWNIWSDGYISQNHTFVASPMTVSVWAKGSVAGGVWPHMRVSVAGTEIGNTNVTTTGYLEYAFPYTATAGSKEIRVTFDNDAIIGSEDRNLIVDKVVLSCGSGGGGGPSTGLRVCDSGAGSYAGIRICYDDGSAPGETFFLGHGVNLLDNRSCGSCGANGSTQPVKWQIDKLYAWGSNFVRLAIETYPNQVDIHDAAYRAKIVEIVNYATAKPGLYVLLSTWIDPCLEIGPPEGSYPNNTWWPTNACIDTWSILADTFRTNPKVLFGIGNEPHDRTDYANLKSLYQQIVAQIRTTEAAQPNFVRHMISLPGNRDWGRYTDYFYANPVADTISPARIAYETHPYPPADYNAAIWQAATHFPLIIGEFSGSGMSDQLPDLARDNFLPYATWAFHAGTCGGMFNDLGSSTWCSATTPYPFDTQETAYGTLVKNKLTAHCNADPHCRTD